MLLSCNVNGGNERVHCSNSTLCLTICRQFFEIPSTIKTPILILELGVFRSELSRKASKRVIVIILSCQSLSVLFKFSQAQLCIYFRNGQVLPENELLLKKVMAIWTSIRGWFFDGEEYLAVKNSINHPERHRILRNCFPFVHGQVCNSVLHEKRPIRNRTSLIIVK